MTNISSIRWLALLVATSCTVSPAAKTEPPQDPELTKLVSYFNNRTWDLIGEKSCVDNGQTFSFSNNTRTMTLSYRKPITAHDGSIKTTSMYQVVGPVLDANKTQLLQVKLEGETRKTDAGELVVWNMRPMPENGFCWHRTDWPTGSCTKPLIECKAVGDPSIHDQNPTDRSIGSK